MLKFELCSFSSSNFTNSDSQNSTKYGLLHYPFQWYCLSPLIMCPQKYFSGQVKKERKRAGGDTYWAIKHSPQPIHSHCIDYFIFLSIYNFWNDNYIRSWILNSVKTIKNLTFLNLQRVLTVNKHTTCSLFPLLLFLVLFPLAILFC